MVCYYETGDTAVGVASDALRAASADESSGTGAVAAYRDDAGVWHPIDPLQEDHYRTQLGCYVATVWVE